jgi:hypothetical protein
MGKLVIHITFIKQPPQGAVIALRCDTYRTTTFIVNEWALKPEKGDYWQFNGSCPDFPWHDVIFPTRKALFPLENL